MTWLNKYDVERQGVLVLKSFRELLEYLVQKTKVEYVQ